MSGQPGRGALRIGAGSPLDLIGLALLELDEDGTIRAASTACCELLGRPSEALIGHRPSEFTHPEDVASSEASILAARSGVVSHQDRYLRPDGSTVVAHLSAAWLPDRKRVVGHLTDLSQVVAAHESAERACARYAAQVEHSSDLIFVIDAGGRLADANPATVRLVGRRLGQSAPALLTELVHPADLAVVLSAFDEAYQGPGLHPEVTFRLRDDAGTWVMLEATANNQLADPAVRGVVVNARDISETVRQLERTKSTMRSLLGALVRATEFRDPYTAGHELKVADLSRRIAHELGLPESECELIELGASVHDIGKIAIPAEILTRPGRLSDLERRMVQMHCEIGVDIIKDLSLAPEIVDIVLHHHERLDGSGYPDGLIGEAISLPARIVAVADVIDAMASHRPYRPARGLEAARAEVRRGSRCQYDPAVVAAALAVTVATCEASTPPESWRYQP